MTKGHIALWIVLVLCGAAAVATAFVVLPRWYAETTTAPVVIEPAQPVAPKIRARLFYVSDDGLRLVAVEREVPVGETTLLQARRIVEAQLEAVSAPLVNPVPAGTTLRALYISDRGEIFVDLSPEVATSHSGGALDEVLTVYALVDAVTANLPTVSAVQILVGGHQVDTLAGHVDLRRPLAKNLSWVQEPGAAPSVDAPVPSAGTPQTDVLPEPPRDTPARGAVTR
jgi:hypothetical protein